MQLLTRCKSASRELTNHSRATVLTCRNYYVLPLPTLLWASALSLSLSLERERERYGAKPIPFNRHSRHVVNSRRYADDIAFIATSAAALRRLPSGVYMCVCNVHVSGEFGLEINISKTKVMVAAQKKTTYYNRERLQQVINVW